MPFRALSNGCWNRSLNLLFRHLHPFFLSPICHDVLYRWHLYVVQMAFVQRKVGNLSCDKRHILLLSVAPTALHLEERPIPSAARWTDILRASLCFLFVSANFVSAPLRTANVVSALALRASPLTRMRKKDELRRSDGGLRTTAPSPHWGLDCGEPMAQGLHPTGFTPVCVPSSLRGLQFKYPWIELSCGRESDVKFLKISIQLESCMYIFSIFA